MSWVYRGDIKLLKSSSNTSITDGNDLYSFEGAVYGVYTSYSNAANDTNAVATLVTDSDGTATVEDLDASRTYYVKEKIAPDGYELDDQIHTVEITDIITVLSVEEQPKITTPPDGYKLDAETGTLTESGDASLAGAQLTVKYYDIATEAEVSGVTPLRTWVLEADENGYIALDEEHFVSGDDFYYDNEGNIVLPIGVVTWQETKAPEGYQTLSPTSS